jgi:hypothetical protein
MQTTLKVVQELRQQQLLQAQQQQAPDIAVPVAHEATETLDGVLKPAAGGAQGVQGSSGNRGLSARPLSNGGAAAAGQHSRVVSPAGWNQRSPASGSRSYLSQQQQNSGKFNEIKRNTVRKGSNGKPAASTEALKAAAACSSLFTPDASRQARANWLAGKLQQQQDAAAAFERDLQKEQLLLQKLAEKKPAAEAAHAQVGRNWCANCGIAEKGPLFAWGPEHLQYHCMVCCVSGQLQLWHGHMVHQQHAVCADAGHFTMYTGCLVLSRAHTRVCTSAQAIQEVWQLTGALQVLATADEQWAAYLEAAKQGLQHDVS